jgi:hypothetical protein
VADLEFTHLWRDEVLHDPETGESWPVRAWITYTQVGGVEHSVVTTTAPDVPAGMTHDEWTAHRQRLNEVALAARIEEEASRADC